MIAAITILGVVGAILFIVACIMLMGAFEDEFMRGLEWLFDSGARLRERFNNPRKGL